MSAVVILTRSRVAEACAFARELGELGGAADADTTAKASAWLRVALESHEEMRARVLDRLNERVAHLARASMARPELAGICKLLIEAINKSIAEVGGAL